MDKTISNQAHVNFSYEGATETKTNDSNVVNSTIRDKYSFKVEKTSTTDCFKPGDVINYIIHVTNDGCGCLTDFKVCDNLGGNDYLSYVENSARLFADGSMTSIAPTNLSPLEFSIDKRLEKGEEWVLTFNATVDENISADVDSITNEVVVKAYPCGCSCQERSDYRCYTETTCYTIDKCNFAEVLITKAISNDNVCCEDELDYFITLTNTGNVDATNVIVTDSLPSNFTATEIHMENNGNHYMFDHSEYDIDASNFLTLPNATGTAILVPALGPGTDNTTRIRIHGHM